MLLEPLVCVADLCKMYTVCSAIMSHLKGQREYVDKIENNYSCCAACSPHTFPYKLFTQPTHAINNQTMTQLPIIIMCHEIPPN